MDPKIFYNIFCYHKIYKDVDDKKCKYILILNKHKYQEVKKKILGTKINVEPALYV